MKLLLLGLLLLLSGAATPPPALVRVTFTPLTKAAYEQAKKQAHVASEAASAKDLIFPVKKQQGRLVIPTAAGNKVFKDKSVPKRLGLDDVTYSYLGFSRKLQQHFIRVNYYESDELLLVEPGGNLISLIGSPTYTPNEQRLVAASCGLMYPIMPNGLQIFEKREGKVVLVWELFPRSWEPIDFFWATDSTLCLKQEQYKNEEPYTPKRFTYKRLLVK